MKTLQRLTIDCVPTENAALTRFTPAVTDWLSCAFPPVVKTRDEAEEPSGIKTAAYRLSETMHELLNCARKLSPLTCL